MFEQFRYQHVVDAKFLKDGGKKEQTEVDDPECKAPTISSGLLESFW